MRRRLGRGVCTSVTRRIHGKAKGEAFGSLGTVDGEAVRIHACAGAWSGHGRVARAGFWFFRVAARTAAGKCNGGIEVVVARGTCKKSGSKAEQNSGARQW